MLYAAIDIHKHAFQAAVIDPESGEVTEHAQLALDDRAPEQDAPGHPPEQAPAGRQPPPGTPLHAGEVTLGYISLGVGQVIFGLRRERRAAALRQTAERQQEGEVRRRAKQQAALARDVTLARASLAAARRRRRSAYAAWLDERDARLPLTRADLRSRSDDAAADAVAAGGGIEAVIAATGLRTRANVLRLIDPATLVRAFSNEARARTAAAAAPECDRLRRLVPDAELVRRRRRRAAAAPCCRLRRRAYDPVSLLPAAEGGETAEAVPRVGAEARRASAIARALSG